MKKRLIVPFLFLGVILASCSNPNKNLKQIDYDLVTPESVITDIKSNIDKKIYLSPKYHYEKNESYNPSNVLETTANYSLIFDDSKNKIVSLYNNKIIYESNELINSIGSKSNDYTNLYGFSTVSFKQFIDEKDVYYIYDSFGNELYKSNESYYSYEYQIESKYNQKFEFRFIIRKNNENIIKYLVYDYEENGVKLSISDSKVDLKYETLFNTETKIGEVSRYGFYSLEKYGDSGYYTNSDGYFSYYDKNYEYECNFKTLFDNYFIIGKYVISYVSEEIKDIRDDYDYLSDETKKNQTYAIYDITSGKKINKNIDIIAIDTIEELSIGYDKESKLYYFNSNIIDNKIELEGKSLITIDDDFDINSVESVDHLIYSYSKSYNDDIYYEGNKKIEFYDDTLTKTLSLTYTDYIDYNYFVVKKDGNYGIVDKQNKIILPFEYSNIIVKCDIFYFNSNILAYKNNHYYSVNLKTGETKELTNFVYNSTYGIGYINVEEVDSNDNIIHKLKIYSGGDLIDEVITDGSNPTITNNNSLCEIKYYDENSESKSLFYFKKISFKLC